MISWCSEENRSSIDAKQKLLSEIVVVVFFERDMESQPCSTHTNYTANSWNEEKNDDGGSIAHSLARHRTQITRYTEWKKSYEIHTELWI